MYVCQEKYVCKAELARADGTHRLSPLNGRAYGSLCFLSGAAHSGIPTLRIGTGIWDVLSVPLLLRSCRFRTVTRES
jgi:hypothetical protein